MKFGEAALQLFGQGFQVIPVNGKRPTVLAWQEEVTEDKVRYWATNGQARHNIGMLTGVGEFPIYAADNDIYDKDVAVRVRKSFVTAFGEGVVRIGQAPKSMMIYQGPAGTAKINGPVWQSPDGRHHKFEFLGKGQQFVAYGTHPDTHKAYQWPNGGLESLEAWEVPEIDPEEVSKWMRDVLPTLIPSDWVVVDEDGEGALPPVRDVMEAFSPRLEISDADVERYLSALDPDAGYEAWTDVGMALHHQYAGSVDGKAIWIEWSRSSKDFNEREIESKWKGFAIGGDGRRPITFASIIFKAKQSDKWAEIEKASKLAARDEWLRRINECTDEHELQDLIEDEIAFDRSLGVVDLRMLEGELIKKFKDMNVPVKTADVRNMLKPKRKGNPSNKANMEEWCEDYVWCNQTDSFIRISTQQIVTVQSFNATHGRDVKGKWITPDGFQMSASQVALQELQIPTVVRRMYLPWADTFFDYDGMSHINLYRPSSVPSNKPEHAWDDGDKDAVNRFHQHVVTLLGVINSNVVLDWMAYCVQKPGDKIKWSILIKGMPGDGKSFLGDVMRAVMGVANVGTVNPKVLNTDFNGWAEGHCVCLLEEIRMAGHNRHDVMNSLKELHTNDIITIHAKKMNSYSACNTQNYLGFTNYADALPLDDQDRRWFIAFSQFNTKEELEAAGLTAAYFVTLFGLLTDHVGALREWLLRRDVSAFNAKGRAPESDAKLAMIANTTSEDDSMIKEIIEEGILGVSKDVISTNLLTAHMSMTHPEFEVPKGRALASVMMRLGFNKVRKPIKWKGATQRLWVRQLSVTENMEKLRELLDATDVPPPECPF